MLFARAGAVALALLVAWAGFLTAAGGRAALQRPGYAAGERWVYVLQGSLGSLPGFNASGGLSFHLDLNGIAEVDVVGPDRPDPASSVRVESHASGFLNGTFTIPLNGTIPGGGTIAVSGTFSYDAHEVWENRSFLPLVSNSSSGYVVEVSLVVKSTVRTNLWTNATTAYGSVPSFALGVGGSASAAFTTNLTTTTSVAFFGMSRTFENRTMLDSTWSRRVLDRENVSVPAGTFSAYRMNESLSGFPGIAGVAPASGANETAWFSNDVGYYVRRVVYLNGTPIAQMNLKSYTYPAPPEGLGLLAWTLIALVPSAAGVVVLLVVRRRRRARAEAKGSSGVGPVGELPPKDRGGEP